MTTLAQLIDDIVYVQLNDSDNKVRWTRDELTAHLNAGIRDLVSRRPEAGVVTDSNLHLVEGALQALPADCARLREIVCNVERVITYPQLVSASVSSSGTTVSLNFDMAVSA